MPSLSSGDPTEFSRPGTATSPATFQLTRRNFRVGGGSFCVGRALAAACFSSSRCRRQDLQVKQVRREPGGGVWSPFSATATAFLPPSLSDAAWCCRVDSCAHFPGRFRVRSRSGGPVHDRLHTQCSFFLSSFYDWSFLTRTSIN